MPQTTDLPFTLMRATMQNMSRALELSADAQVQFARFRLKAAETALDDLHDAQAQLASAHSWAAMAAMPGVLMKAQSNRNTIMLKSWVDLLNSVQADWIRHAREWNEQLQNQQVTAPSPIQFFTATTEPMKAFFNHFDILAKPNSEARSHAQLRSATEAGRASAA